VNTTMYDMEEIAQATAHVFARPRAQGGSDDPSLVTAYGTYLGIKAGVRQVYGTDTLSGRKVGVEGIGKVGSHLVARLCQEGAQVYVTDIVQERLTAIAQQHAVHVVSPAAFYDLPLDVYAPCALGATLNDATIARLQCAIVAGAANNQLADEQRHSQLLFDRGIVYVPDFVVNAGGLINISVELEGPYSLEQAYRATEHIYDTCQEILRNAALAQRSPQVIAEQMVQQRLAAARTTTAQQGE
ncbi:MAG: Glu/Leu/Phe/Val dehydrogenase family protein, partial [Bacteroidota bacterium]